MDCWIDINGEKQCPVNTGGNLNACDPYGKIPSAVSSSPRVPMGRKGASGQCYVNDVVYDCGEDVKVEKTQAETVYKCPGSIDLSEVFVGRDRCIQTLASHTVHATWALIDRLGLCFLDFDIFPQS